MDNISFENKKVRFRQWHTNYVYVIYVVKHDLTKSEIVGELIDSNGYPSYLDGQKILMHTDAKHVLEVLD